MFCWFIATAIVTIAVVFRDPRFDYRLLIVGSVVPLLDGLFGGARVLHSVTVAVALLALVVLATAGRKPSRKLLLGLPIGIILHLVFDGAWSTTEVFWWPFFGWGFDDAELPEVARGWWSLVLEAAGIAVCVWLWRRNGLGTASRRRRFLADGHLDANPSWTA